MTGREHPTVEQNRAHRNDMTWIRSTGKNEHGWAATANGENYQSEYHNPFTDQFIRKSWRMTGRDWHLFDAEGNVVERLHSLTWAKYRAAELAGASDHALAALPVDGAEGR